MFPEKKQREVKIEGVIQSTGRRPKEQADQTLRRKVIGKEREPTSLIRPCEYLNPVFQHRNTVAYDNRPGFNTALDEAPIFIV
ncbi:hypothetical protein BHYA_0001g00850 [Botrytis hyacinthi]|uniref:Uncharacterized protein n=1 Tax=Botrytis hyacinthi TaxID=278943 RepID=A0A4Z1H2L4_9HELO|nr:hypothetical protein BHYA_0001g00850 [Botrytis hyacinthi]